MSERFIALIAANDAIFNKSHPDYGKPNEHVWRAIASQSEFQDWRATEAAWVAYCSGYILAINLARQGRAPANFKRFAWLDMHLDERDGLLPPNTFFAARNYASFAHPNFPRSQSTMVNMEQRSSTALGFEGGGHSLANFGPIGYGSYEVMTPGYGDCQQQNLYNAIGAVGAVGNFRENTRKRVASSALAPPPQTRQPPSMSSNSQMRSVNVNQFDSADGDQPISPTLNIDARLQPRASHNAAQIIEPNSANQNSNFLVGPTFRATVVEVGQTLATVGHNLTGTAQTFSGVARDLSAMARTLSDMARTLSDTARTLSDTARTLVIATQNLAAIGQNVTIAANRLTNLVQEYNREYGTRQSYTHSAALSPQ